MPGRQVGIVGSADLATKIERATGGAATVFTTSETKRADAERRGAACVVPTDKAAMATLERGFDLLRPTMPKTHKVDLHIPSLTRDAASVAVGAIAELPGYSNQELIFGRRSLAGSLIDGIAGTQEVLEFCAAHGIAPDIQVIPFAGVTVAYKCVNGGEVRFRYVIDRASLQQEIAAA